MALGTNSSATHTNAAAFGQGATTARANQQMFGTGSNTYTMAGITSAQSYAAQGTATRLVTSNDSGDLVARTFAELGFASSGDITNINNQIASLGRQTDVALAGVAMAFAMAGTPSLGADENFALSINLGHYEGHNATSLGAALRLTDGVQMTGSAAYSDTQDSFGGRVGMRFGW